MCSAPEKLEHSRQSPLGPRETFSGSQSDSPAGTATFGLTRGRLRAGSSTRNSSSKGLEPRFEILTAEAKGEPISDTVMPSGSLPLAGLGRAAGRMAASSGPQLRRSAASRRRAPVVGRSSPLRPTAPLRRKDEESGAQPTG